jgi:ABC-2 type transport system permease protein
MMKFKFIKKEFMEFFKTYRFFVLFGIFLFFAFLNAPTARYMKDIFGMMGESGLVISIPDPVFTDAYGQFFKNTSTALIALVIVYMASVSGEIKKGTIYLVLSKGLSRMDFFFSKVITAFLMYTLAYAVSALVTSVSAFALFGEWHTEGLFPAFASYWAFGLLALMVTLSVSAMTRASGYPALAGMFVLIFVPLTGYLQKLGRYLPGKLASLPVELVMGGDVSSMWGPMISALAISAVFLTAGAFIFNKKEL